MFGILVECDIKMDLVIYVGRCEVLLHVQRFYLLFYAIKGMLGVVGILFQFKQILTRKYR